ncbi:hypothetical protein LTR62_002052 [Meristemomyces frigidus]|uniref:Mitochondrial import inner membrane translocase subunit TIM54 n=1 Tax=Meristemomyces frigidus TaxID=1508187 RepID=A0AAN7TJW5_9PEZI|nr:hypothetical protein LTR62_002052 [Meristemomyces frigidus]
MGLPRLRLPSRNWIIFLSLSGSIASAVLYDKYQTRKVKEKWCNTVSHLAEQTLDTKSMPRRLTIYLAAPPGDGLRSAREHFHEYVKPVLVAGAMDWEVVEGRKEGDVRFKTAERIRRKRKRGGEGQAMPEEEMEKDFAMDIIREKNGTTEYPDIAGDIIIGRHTWKEYVRGLHEGWLGPTDAPAVPEEHLGSEAVATSYDAGHSSLGDAAVKGAAEIIAPHAPSDDASASQVAPLEDVVEPTSTESVSSPEEKKEEDAEKPKRRHPAPYISPIDYLTASSSPSTPEIIGPSTAISFPHLLGIRNTPIRVYRFLTRRYLADSIGREVAAAVLGTSYRSFGSVSISHWEEGMPTREQRTVPEQAQVLAHEEKEWWKTVHRKREEHEEGVWIEDCVVDERLGSRMRAFQLGAEDEDRAKAFGEGRLKPKGGDEEGT